MLDYEKDQRADRWAHRYRWYVWLSAPAVFVLAAIPWHEIVEMVGGILWWSFGK